MRSPEIFVFMERLEQRNLTCRWQVSRDGLTERNFYLPRGQMQTSLAT